MFTFCLSSVTRLHTSFEHPQLVISLKWAVLRTRMCRNEEEGHSVYDKIRVAKKGKVKSYLTYQDRPTRISIILQDI